MVEQVPKGGGAWGAKPAERWGRGKPYHLWSEGAPRVMLKELHETRG